MCVHVCVFKFIAYFFLQGDFCAESSTKVSHMSMRRQST